MNYAGLDLHRRFSVITVLDGEGKLVSQVKVPNGEEIVKFLRGFADPVEVAIEASANWYWICDLLQDNGIAMKLAHPLKTKAIACARVKNDKIDSNVLAHLLRANLLPTSYIPEKPIRMNRELLRYRASLVRIQTG